MRASQSTWLRVSGAVLGAVLVASTTLDAQERAIVVRASWLIDATGRPPVADAVVVVRGNRIAEVGPAGSVAIPSGAEVVNLQGQTLLPGLIDTHSHLTHRSMFPMKFGGPQQSKAPPNELMMKAVRFARVLLLCGVTTVRQVGEYYNTDTLLRDGIAVGMHPGPRIISAGETLTTTGGHGLGTYSSDGPAAMRLAVRKNFATGAEWIKLINIDQTPTTSSLSKEELTAAIDEAHRLGLKVTVHATGRWGAGMRTAIEAGADTIEHARPLTEEMVKLMLEHGTGASVTPMAYVGWFPVPKTYEFLDTGAKNATEWMEYLDQQIADYRKAHPENETADRPFVSPLSDHGEGWRVNRDMFQAIKTVQQQYLKAYEMKLPMSLGLDNRLGGQAWQIQFLVDAGIPAMDAIRAATSSAAKLIAWDDRIGTVEKGKFADLISVQGEPLKDIKAMREIRFIMKDGVRYDMLSWR